MGKRQPLPRNAFSNPPFSMLPFFGKYFLRQIIHAQSNIERGKGRGKVGNNKRRNHMRNEQGNLLLCSCETGYEKGIEFWSGPKYGWESLKF